VSSGAKESYTELTSKADLLAMRVPSEVRTIFRGMLNVKLYPDLLRFALALALIAAVSEPAVNIGGSDRTQGFG
jgi:hypothetical protein